MKTISSIFIVAIILFCSCKKHHEADPVVPEPVPLPCMGLVTDTTGTNDTARIFMPNAFSPNSDGINDVSRPIFIGVASFTFSVYDENNNIVYNTDQFSQGFSPTTPPATYIKYYYKIQAVTLQNHHIGECGELYSLSCLPPGTPASTFYLEDELMAGRFLSHAINGSCNIA